MSADPLPPAFFPVSLNLVGRRCLVIGDDAEAAAKEHALRDAGADVVWLKDAARLDETYLRDVFFIISTPRDEPLSARLRALADERRILLCTIDQPAYGFVAMQAIVKAGPARISISTGGVSPRVGKVLKLALERALDATFARFLDCLATQRRRNRARLGSVAERRAAMMDAAEGFDVTVGVSYPGWFNEEIGAQRPVGVASTDSGASR